MYGEGAVGGRRRAPMISVHGAVCTIDRHWVFDDDMSDVGDGLGYGYRTSSISGGWGKGGGSNMGLKG